MTLKDKESKASVRPEDAESKESAVDLLEPTGDSSIKERRVSFAPQKANPAYNSPVTQCPGLVSVFPSTAG